MITYTEIDGPKLVPEELVDVPNIAVLLTEEQLIAIGANAVEGYDTDEESRHNWIDRYDKTMKLALQVVETKTTPWAGAANVKYPLITIAALQFGARSYPSLITGTDIVRGKVNGFDKDGLKTEAAIRVGKHMSYQLLEEIEGWEEDMDKLTATLPLAGCLFKKTYYSDTLGTNVSELIRPKNFCVNYWTKNLATCPRKTEVIQLQDNDVYERTVTGLFLEDVDLDKVIPDTDTVSDDANGKTPPAATDGATPFVFIEQHGFIDLDNDGYKEPYIITVHLASKQVVRIAPCFDLEDIERDMSGKVTRISQTQYYTKYPFIPNPDGSFYDVGFGSLLGPLNESINTIINQLLDAGTLSNLQAGFLSRGIRIKGGNKPFAPGEWKTVNSTGDDLRKGIVPLPVREPSNVLFQMLGMLIDGGQKVSSVTDMLMGENPGQNQPATTSMALLEQGEKVFNSINKRLHRSMKSEFQKMHRLNRIYLPPQSYFQVLDLGQEQTAQINSTDYQKDVTDVTAYSDPNINSRAQKLMKAQQLEGMMANGLVNVQEGTKRILEASEQPNIDALLAPNPDPGPGPEHELEEFRVHDESEREWELISLKRVEIDAKADKTDSDIEKDARTSDREDVKMAVEALEKGKERNEGNNKE